MFFYSHVAPVHNAIPTPGKDMPDASWRQHMGLGDVALFLLDAKSGQLLRPRHEVPQLPVQEVCMIFGSRYTARLDARGHVMSKPQVLAVLYDRRGRWLSTRSRDGETRRNPGLGLAWILLQFPLLAICGALGLLAVSYSSAWYFGIGAIRLNELSQPQIVRLLAGGLMLGGFARLLLEFVRVKLVAWHARAALAPVGSPQREKMYRRIAKQGGGNRLLPSGVSLEPATIEWPVPEKHAEWTAVLQAHGFQHLGQFQEVETKGGLDIWFDTEHDLTGIVLMLPTRGMWLAVFTRYEDGSSFSAANKLPAGMDLPPRKKTVYLGLEASAESVIDRALRDRPEGIRRRPSAENLLDDYKKSWKDSVDWRRMRGTTAEEIRRLDQARGEPRAIGETPCPASR